MNIERIRQNTNRHNNQYSCIGAGLVALDLILTDKLAKSFLWAGGSCGNVLTILAYLGWNTFPIARIGEDQAGKIIIEDMIKWGTNTEFISVETNYNTPIIIERLISKANGKNKHKFEFHCPSCGNMLPRYRPVRLMDICKIDLMNEKHEVFYFDRVSPGIIKLAKASKSCGRLIFFEPSSIKDPRQFVECLKLADIVKYSNERLHNITEFTKDIKVPLEIQTQGEKGLVYKIRESDWIHLSPFNPSEVQDSAGAGDWTSAGIIHILASQVDNLAKVSEELIYEAIKFGQMLASLNCEFVGARGIMYNISKHEYWNALKSINKGEHSDWQSLKTHCNFTTKSVLCPFCNMDFSVHVSEDEIMYQL